MAGNFSNYLENKVLDHILGVASYSMPSTVYLALFTALSGDAASVTEVSGSGYSRQATTFGSASSGTITNSSAETFTASGGNFGTITHVGLYDASTSGNLLVWLPMDTNRTINDGESLTFNIGEIEVSLD